MKLIRHRYRTTATIFFGATLLIWQNSFALIERLAAQNGPSRLDPATGWLLESAHPLKTLEPGSNSIDLQPLKSILRDVNIVGLGEGSHGTREFIQLKHRLVEFLVKNMGYTLFVTELSYATSLAINEYVLNENGATNLSVIKRPWPLDTEEWNALIEWMREYNKSVPRDRKVRFLGYDTRPTPEVLELVTSYLRRVAPDQVEFAKSALSPVLGEQMPELDLAVTLPNNGRPQHSEEEKKRIHDDLNKLVDLFVSNRLRFTGLTSMKDFNRVMHLVRTVEQFDDIFSRPWVSQTEPTNTGIAIREIYAAQNVEWLLESEKPATRMILWAHNGHVSTGYVYASVPTMGSYLRDKFGSAYYAVTLMFNQGSFQARNLDTEDSQYGSVMGFTLGPARQGTTEWYFAHAGLKNYYVDLRSAPREGPVADWLGSALLMKYLLGGGFSRRWPSAVYARPIALRRYYDGAAFIDETTCAHPNASGIRAPVK